MKYLLFNYYVKYYFPHLFQQQFSNCSLVHIISKQYGYYHYAKYSFSVVLTSCQSMTFCDGWVSQPLVSMVGLKFEVISCVGLQSINASTEDQPSSLGLKLSVSITWYD